MLTKHVDIDITCWQSMLTKHVDKTCRQNMLTLTKHVDIDKACWHLQSMLTKHVDKTSWQTWSWLIWSWQTWSWQTWSWQTWSWQTCSWIFFFFLTWSWYFFLTRSCSQFGIDFQSCFFTTRTGRAFEITNKMSIPQNHGLTSIDFTKNPCT